MIIVMQPWAQQEEIEAVVNRIEEFGYSYSNLNSNKSTVLFVNDIPDAFLPGAIRSMKGVGEVIHVFKPFSQIQRLESQENTVIKVNGLSIGGNEITVMAGPSVVERKDEMLLAAYAIKEAGAKVLRGGAYKIRINPSEIPELGRERLDILKAAKDETGLLITTEVRNPQEVQIVDEYADIIQIGARSTSNYELLAAVAESKKPILLKRGMAFSVEEWLIRAQYIVKRGNPNVILCERGIRTFEKYTAFTLDLSSIPVLKRYTHLPVMVDPSHAVGDAHYVPAMAKAAVAAGADGLMIEVHPNPSSAVIDGVRQMEPQKFKDLMQDLKLIAKAIGRTI